MPATFTITHTTDGQFRFVLAAANHEKLLTSETYRRKASVSIGIAAVRCHAEDDARYGRRTDAKGQPYFVLTAANGEIIGVSESYSSLTALERGIQAFRRAAPEAMVVDQAGAA
jgi:uncharacterized protein YegP (UPF0339 family)